MKSASDGNNDPISLDQLVDNSAPTEDQNASATVVSDEPNRSTDEPLIREPSSSEIGDDAEVIPLDLLIAENSSSSDNLNSKESSDSDVSSRGRENKDSKVSGVDGELSYDAFLLTDQDDPSRDNDIIPDNDADCLDSVSADLASAYEATLLDNLSPAGKVEVLVQAGSTYVRQENDYAKAERVFRNVRNLDPTNPIMLDFYRQYSEKLPNNDMLKNVLLAALNATREKQARFEFTKEIVLLTCTNDRLVDRSIQLWKAFLRDYPDDPDANEELKRIFSKYGKWNNLLAFINNQIKALSSTAVEEKKELYREIIQTFGNLPEHEKVVIESYRLLFQIEPQDKEVFDILVGFYQSHGRWKNLIDLLMTRSSVTKDTDEKSECLLRAAKLQIEKFKNYSAAEDPLTLLIAMDRRHLEAIEMLRSVFRHRRDWQKLFDLINENLDLYEGGPKLEAVLEMARTASSFSLSNTNAVALWQTVLELDPRNQEAFNNLEKYCDRNENWDAFVHALDQAILAATEDKQRVLYLVKQASIHNDKRKDLSSAIDAWKQLLTIDPNHSKAFLCLKKAYFETCDIDALEDLYIQSQDNRGLFDTLNALVNKTDDVQVKTTLLKRCADLQQNVLNNVSKATQFLEKILSYNPSDLEARIDLLPVYHSNKQWKKFLNILDSILGDNKDYRYEFKNTDDLLTLEKQAEISQKWSVLVYLKQLRIEMLQDNRSQRDALSFSIASILEEKLKRYNEAVTIYKELMSVPELNDRVISRMLVLLDQDSVKYEIARTLFDRNSNLSTDLVSLKVFSIILEKPSSEFDIENIRRRYNQEIESFIEKHHSDPRTLFSSLLALLKNNRSNVSIRKTLFDLAGQLKRYDELVGTLTDIYNNSNLDDDNELAYAEEIAAIYDTQLGKTDKAAFFYKKIFDASPDRRDVFEKLELIFKRSANWNDLLNVYEVAMKKEKDSRKLGHIANSIVSTLDRAKIDVDKRVYYLSAVNERDCGVDGVVDRLIEAFREKGDWKLLADVVSTHLSRRDKEDEKEKYHLILADLYFRRLGNIEEAIKRHLSVLSTNPTCAETQKFFEDLLHDEKYQFKAIEILKTIYRRQNDVASYLRILERELADQNRSDQERFSTTVEVALLYDNHLNNIDTAFDYITKAFVLDPSNEEVRIRMRSYAERAKKGKRYCEVIEPEIKKLRSGDKHATAVTILFEYAGYLSEKGEMRKAMAIYWRMIEWYAANDSIVSRAVSNIHSIDPTNYSSEDRIKLANIELKIEKNPAKKRDILFQIATVQENEIGSLKDAEATIIKILKIDGNDKDALQALSRIYESERRWNDLIEILKKLASIETEPKVKRDILIRISKLATHM